MNDWHSDDFTQVPWEDSYFDRPIDLFPGMSICVSNEEDLVKYEDADGYLHIRMKATKGEKDWAIFFKFSPDMDWDKREFSVLDAVRFSKLIAEEVVDSVQDPNVQLMRVWFLDVERFGLDFKSVMYGGSEGRIMRSAWGPGDEPQAVNG
jgi:hypothetical protein